MGTMKSLWRLCHPRSTAVHAEWRGTVLAVHHRHSFSPPHHHHHHWTSPRGAPSPHGRRGWRWRRRRERVGSRGVHRSASWRHHIWRSLSSTRRPTTRGTVESASSTSSSARIMLHSVHYARWLHPANATTTAPSSLGILLLLLLLILLVLRVLLMEPSPGTAAADARHRAAAHHGCPSSSSSRYDAPPPSKARRLLLLVSRRWIVRVRVLLAAHSFVLRRRLPQVAGENAADRQMKDPNSKGSLSPCSRLEGGRGGRAYLQLSQVLACTAASSVKGG